MNRKNSGKLAIAGLVIIALIGVYLYRADPLGWQSNALMASKSTPEMTQSEPSDTKKAPDSTQPVSAVSDLTASEGGSENEETQAAATQSPTSKSDTPADDLEEAAEAVAAAIPGFDVVRVEPDGSTLIAGHGAPDSTIEIVRNGEVLATTKAGTTGDFAFVMDEPLPAGNHEIILRAVGEDDSITDSQEIAMISVPESDPTKLLVMVTKPGEASRIINQPKITETEQTASQTAMVGGDADATATQPASEIVADSGAVADKQPSDMTSNKEIASAKEMTSAETATEDEVAAETPKSDDEAGEMVAASKENAAVSNESSDAETALAESSDTATEDEAASIDADTSNQEETVVANLAADTGESNQPADDNKPAMAAATKLRIDAVEIEAGQIFVAGSATPGATVRVTADGEVIGTSQVSKNGRFLVEANKDIAVGEHTIGADLKLAGSTDTAMRVAVPFTRPEGELVAAVAAPAAPAAPVAKAEEETDTAMAAVEKADEQTATGDDAATDADEDTVAAQADTKADSNVVAGIEAAKTEMAAVDTKEISQDPASSSTTAVDAAADADEDTVAAETDTMADTDAAADAESEKSEMAAVDTKETAEDSAPSSSTTTAVVDATADADEDTVAAESDTMADTDAAAGAEAKKPEMAAVVDTKEPAEGSAPSSTTTAVVDATADADEDTVAAESDAMADTDAAAGAEAEKSEMAAGDTKTPSDSAALSSATAKAEADKAAGTDTAKAVSDATKVAEAEKPELAAVDAMEPSAGAPSSPDVAVTAGTDVVADEVEDTVAAGTDTKAGSDAAASAAAAKPEVAAVDTQAPSSGAAPTSTTVAADMDADEDTVAATDSAYGTEVSKLATNMEADGPETIMQPALQPVDSSVIIRRGDTLWQISLRIYGKGVRYTTIYLANEDEIENPDFIEPGQIFAVPDKPLDNAEKLHRDRILHN